jgi:hypothetical protein|tara:strand:+ start:702 stop:950 length:249 start_codon:yes stop_codon:yes gene_type:complete
MKRVYRGVKRYHRGAKPIHYVLGSFGRLLILIGVPMLFVEAYRSPAIGIMVGGVFLNLPMLRQVYYRNYKIRKRQIYRRKKK